MRNEADYWKHEAQLNAAAAGELKISIAIKQLQQHIDRLEAILYGQNSTADH